MGTPPTASPSGVDGSRRPVSRWGAIAIAATFLLLAGLQVVNVLSRPRTDDDRDKMLGALTDPRNPRWTLTSTDAANPRSLATAVIDDANRRILVRGPLLPELETGQIYVLWAMPRDESAPRNLTAFQGKNLVLDAVVVNAPVAKDLKALSISVERDPRVTAPSRVVATGGS